MHVTNPSMRTNSSQQISEVRIISHHHSAFDCRDVMGEIEAEAGEVAEGADYLTVPGDAERFTGVFEQPEVSPPRYRLDRTDIDGAAQNMNHHDGGSVGGNGRL